MAISMLAYFAYMILEFDGDIQKTLVDWRTWIHTAFVIFLNTTMLSGAFDSGVSVGINSEEFEIADKLNNKLIGSVNNEMEDFRKFIKILNQHELKNIQEDFLFKVGDKKVEDLTKRELKQFKKLKPVRHDIYGFNLPLYYELSKNGTIKYQASIKKNQGKFFRIIKKVVSGAMFAGMTINVVFSVGRVGPAFVSLLIISAGLVMTFLLTFFPQVYKFKVELPKKVILKNTLYDSYIDYKNGTHVLKKIELNNVSPVIETKQPITNELKDNPLTEGISNTSPYFKNNPLGI